jgi:outer membrane protein assembly factor BamD (BamD/ComL family)
MMQANAYRIMNAILRAIMITLCGVYIIASAGCASVFQSSSQSKSARQHGGAKTQQYYYDQGLQQYAKENFGEAKESFQRAIDAGPNTTLGMKAQENLRKIHQILKTVEDIESK